MRSTTGLAAESNQDGELTVLELRRLEGRETDDPAVRALRRRQMRNFIAA